MYIRILLADRLDERGLSQRKLHELTGIRLQTINEYCRELADRINIEHIAKICTVLNCGISDILDLVDEHGESVAFPQVRADADCRAILQSMADTLRPFIQYPDP